MQLATLEKLGDTLVLTMPASVVGALHLHAGEELIIEIEGERIVLTRTPTDYRPLQVVYQTLEQHYHTAQVAS